MSAIARTELCLDRMQVVDLDAVLAIERAVYEFPWTRGNFSDSLRAGYGCWIGRREGSVVGYFVLMVAAEEAHLLNLSVAPEFQRQGNGRRLLRHALDKAAQQSARLLFLEVRPSNAAARALYAASGFRQIGVRRDYYPSAWGREDALVLATDLH